MKFWKRLRTYLVGVGLGLVMVYFFFGDRDLSFWTPQGRVLIAIDSSSQVISEKAVCQLACYGFSDTTLWDIQSMASVDFSESDTRKEPCPIYTLKSIWQDEVYTLIWEVCESAEEVELLSLERLKANCPC